VTNETDDLGIRAKRLGLYGLATQAETLTQLWVPILLEIEERERQRRSLERRKRNARLSTFKPISDFDWTWPKRIDREAINELFTLAFIAEGANVILLGPNGVGKTTLAQNLGYEALIRGHTVLTTTASDMLNDLAAQDGTTALNRRIRRYAHPRVLVIDEVGYLSYDNRHADLLYEVISRRYREEKPIIVTTNKPFSEWPSVFPNAACVVTLIDRLMHRAEVIQIEADSYRLKDAKERTARKAKARSKKPDPPDFTV